MASQAKRVRTKTKARQLNQTKQGGQPIAGGRHTGTISEILQRKRKSHLMNGGQRNQEKRTQRAHGGMKTRKRAGEKKKQIINQTS